MGAYYLSYDADNKLWYSWSTDNFGGSIAYGTSPGWSGDTITFSLYMMKNGKWTSGGRVTTTKVSATEIRDTMWDEKGKVAFSDDCKKQ